MSEDEESYPKAGDNDGASSEESWDDGRDNRGSILPAAALMTDPQTSGEITPDSAHDGMLARDIQRKTAYYDYTAEKQLSQADAKLFYQRSQLEAQRTGGSNWDSQQSPQGSPVMTGAKSVSTMSNVGNPEQSYVRRSNSMRSMQSGKHTPS
jgi:AMP deaminase